MEDFLPKSFIQIFAGIFSICSLVAFFISFKQTIRIYALRLLAIMIICALTLFSDNGWVYFATVFIIATVITETEFLQNLAAIIKGGKHYFAYKQATEGQIQAPKSEQKPTTSPMEYKILNTLWTKQVNKFPDFSRVFTFRINANSPEFLGFREAGNKLIGKELITETDQGHFHLTQSGFKYCKENYREFPPDQWWPEETINFDNLRKVIG